MSETGKGRLCTIFKGSRREELYVFVDKRSGLQEVPQELLDSLGKITEVMTLHITPERRLARAKAEEVLREIAAKGYFVQLPPGEYPPGPAVRDD